MCILSKPCKDSSAYLHRRHAFCQACACDDGIVKGITRVLHLRKKGVAPGTFEQSFYIAGILLKEVLEVNMDMSLSRAGKVQDMTKATTAWLQGGIFTVLSAVASDPIAFDATKFAALSKNVHFFVFFAAWLAHSVKSGAAMGLIGAEFDGISKEYRLGLAALTELSGGFLRKAGLQLGEISDYANEAVRLSLP